MHVFRLVVAVAVRHWNYLAIYMGVLTAAAVCMGLWSGGAQGASPVEERPSVAVVDRDGSEVSRAIGAYVERIGEAVEIEGSTRALQDAAAKDLASYVLVIPEGYGGSLVAAADAGEAAPALQTVVGRQGADGARVDVRVRAYASALYGFAASTDADPGRLVAWADEVCAAETPVVYAQEGEPSGLPDSYRTFAAFSGYAIFCATVVFISVGMAPVERPDARRRLLVSPVPALSFGVQSGVACVVFGLAIWAVEAAVGLAVFGGDLAGCDPGLVAAAVASQFCYMLFSVACGFLLWRLRVGEEYANAVGNIFGTLFSFLGGAWLSLDLMGEGFQAVARFTPGYWAIDVTTAVSQASSLTGDVLARVGVDLGIVLLFAAVVFVVGLAVRSERPTRANAG